MKDLKNKWLRAFMVLLMATTILSTSCNKDDDDDNNGSADYVGKWTTDVIVATDEEETDHKDVINLTKTTFEYDIQTKVSADKWESTLVLKGTITANGQVLDVHISELGSPIDPVSGEMTGTVTFYKEGNLLFEFLLLESGQKKDFDIEYSISGNKMTLKTDNNEDGDFNDFNETMVYTRI